MKIAILIIAAFISLPALAGVLVKDFRIVPPGKDYSQSPVLPKTGNCYLKGWELNSGDTDSIVFFHVIENGSLAGEEQSILVKGKNILVDIRTCGKEDGYQHSVTTKGDGSRTLNVKCKGSVIEGQGSGSMNLTIDRNGIIQAYSLKKRAGWWENFRGIEMSCKF